MSTNLSYTFIFKAYDLAVDIIVNIRIPVTVSILNLTLDYNSYTYIYSGISSLLDLLNRTTNTIFILYILMIQTIQISIATVFILYICYHFTGNFIAKRLLLKPIR